VALNIRVERKHEGIRVFGKDCCANNEDVG